MSLLIACLISISFLLWLISLWEILTKKKRLLNSRLESLAVKDKEDELNELNKPLKERVFVPLLTSLSSLFAKILPKRGKENIEKRLVLAGVSGTIKAHEFMAVQVVLALLFFFGAGTVMFLVQFNPFITAAGAAGLAFLGYYFPGLYLRQRIRNRQREIQKLLPDVVDLLTVSVEAGLGFDAAIAKVTSKIKGEISKEFDIVLKEIKMGKPRRDALKDMVARTQVDDFSNFIGAVVQADRLGVSMGNMLRIQSGQMRVNRRQLAEEKAMKAPIKMLFPLVFFIFPSIFIVLLGPAFIQVMKMFMSM
ncbi:MAG: type II secretion system F family protein [Bacillota bacterium]